MSEPSVTADVEERFPLPAVQGNASRHTTFGVIYSIKNNYGGQTRSPGQVALVNPYTEAVCHRAFRSTQNAPCNYSVFSFQIHTKRQSQKYKKNNNIGGEEIAIPNISCRQTFAGECSCHLPNQKKINSSTLKPFAEN